MSKLRLECALQAIYGNPVPSMTLQPLRGDASTRRYYRAQVENSAAQPSELIVMQLPEDAFGSDEGGSRTAAEQLPFLEVQQLLASRGIPVPKVYAEDLDSGVVLLEDLGDTTLHQALEGSPPARFEEMYRLAVELLAQMHERCADLPATSIVSRRRFDRELVEWELEHFRQWGLEAPFGELGPSQLDTLRAAFARIADEIEHMPIGFVHRDYQSKNLMVRDSGELVVLDFQDALLGPRVYDLVALLCDSYVPLEQGFQQLMIDRYAALRHLDRDTLRAEFWWVALHRKLKDAGRFVYIDRVRGNPDFLQWFPQSLVYVGRAARGTPGMAPLERLLRDVIAGFPDAVPPPSFRAE